MLNISLEGLIWDLKEDWEDWWTTSEDIRKKIEKELKKISEDDLRQWVLDYFTEEICSW